MFLYLYNNIYIAGPMIKDTHRSHFSLVIMLIFLLASLVVHSLAMLTDPTLQVDSGFDSLKSLESVPLYPLPDGGRGISDPTAGPSIISSEIESPELVSQQPQSSCHARRNSKLRVRESSSDQAGNTDFCFQDETKVQESGQQERKPPTLAPGKQGQQGKKGNIWGPTPPEKTPRTQQIWLDIFRNGYTGTQTEFINQNDQLPDNDRLKCKFQNYKIHVCCSGPPEPPASVGPIFNIMKSCRWCM